MPGSACRRSSVSPPTETRSTTSSTVKPRTFFPPPTSRSTVVPPPSPSPAHSKQEQSDDSRVTHPKRRSQDTARGCVEQANSHRRLLLLALERDQQASPSAG